MKLSHWLPVGLLVATVAACEDTTTIGSSIIQDKIEVIVDSSFTVTGVTVDNPVVQGRTDRQLLGRIDARSFGSLSSDFITQFMPASHLDTFYVSSSSLDSMKLRMFMQEGSLVGDSLAPMGLEVYRLNKALPNPIYSDFDPSGYYSASDLLATTPYTATVLGLSEREQGYYTHPDTAVRVVDVKMPMSLAREFWDKYQTDPDMWNDPVRFSEWFPGIYVKNSFGTGRIMSFYATLMYMYFTRHYVTEEVDSLISGVQAFLSVTPEVVCNNNLALDIASDIKELSKTTPVVLGPVGYDTQLTLPIQAMVDKYRMQTNEFSVLNTFTMFIPAEKVTNVYGIDPPAYLLLIRKDKKADFFSKQQLADNVTSFYAAYDATAGGYSFSSMRGYFLDAQSKGSELTAADGEFILTPVTLLTESNKDYYGNTQTTVMAIVPYINAPAMATLNVDKAKLTLTFSKQTLP